MKIFWGAVLALTCIPGMATAQDFDGPRIEARIGYETPTVSNDDDDIYTIGSAVSYGAEIGYDMKVSESIVVGPYVTYEFSDVKLCGDACVEVDGNLGVGARLGYIVGPRGLFYAKLGYASLKSSISQGVNSISDTQGGVQGAIGYEMNFGKSFYGKLEGNYGDYGKYYDVNLQRRQIVTGFGLRF